MNSVKLWLQWFCIKGMVLPLPHTPKVQILLNHELILCIYYKLVHAISRNLWTSYWILIYFFVYFLIFLIYLFVYFLIYFFVYFLIYFFVYFLNYFFVYFLIYFFVYFFAYFFVYLEYHELPGWTTFFFDLVIWFGSLIVLCLSSHPINRLCLHQLLACKTT